MTFRQAMTGLALAAALIPGLAVAQVPARPLMVADLLGASVEAANGRMNGALKPAWAGIDGTTIYVPAVDRCRVAQDGEADPMNLALLTRNGRVEAVLRQPPVIITFNGTTAHRLSPSADPFASAPGALPLDDGPQAATGRLAAQSLPTGSVLQVACVEGLTVYAPPEAPEGLETVAILPGKAIVAIAFAPIWLFGVPDENRSRKVGATQGPLALAEVTLGQPLAGGAEAFRARHRAVVRVHRGGGDYAVVTIDLGGPPGRGVSLPREAVYVGVRGGLVEWIGDGSSGLRYSLCTAPGGRFGGRKGCTTTGYYDPRV